MDREDAFLKWQVAWRARELRAFQLTRRELLKHGSRAALTAGALAALVGCGTSAPATVTKGATGGSTSATGGGAASPATGSPSANVQLPEITSVPENLKGSGEVRVVSFGGALQEAQRKAYFEPFQRLTGIKIVEGEGPDTAKVKAMVDSGNVEWDVAEFDRASVINLQKKGDYWEPINYDLTDTANIDEARRYQYSIDMLPYATIFAYRTDVFTGNKPASWQDFWNVSAFPGPRAMTAGSGGLSPDLEQALMADGVAPEQIYPIDIDRAYTSLGKIKPAVVKWWEAGAVPAQMLSDKEAHLAVAWNGRIAAIQAQGAPVAISWNNGLAQTDVWAVPKGAKNKENAMKLIAFITLPISQARLSMLIPYGFVNNKAADYIPPERLAVLPTAPDIKRNLITYNSQWWADNLDTVLNRWNEFILS